uniref:hypothetical protein n=1 Tax=Myxobolus shantungensis TaxID=904554 RepID=UPI003001F328
MENIKFEVCYFNKDFYLKENKENKEDVFEEVFNEEDCFYNFKLNSNTYNKLPLKFKDNNFGNLDKSFFNSFNKCYDSYFNYNVKDFLYFPNYYRNLFLEVSGLEIEEPSEKRLMYFFNKEKNLILKYNSHYFKFFNTLFEKVNLNNENYINKFNFNLLSFENVNLQSYNKIYSKEEICNDFSFINTESKSLELNKKNYYYGNKYFLKYIPLEEGCKLVYIKFINFYFGVLNKLSFSLILKNRFLIKNSTFLLQVLNYSFWNKFYLSIKGLCLGNLHINFKVEKFSRGYYKTLKEYMPNEFKSKGVIKGEVESEYVHVNITEKSFEPFLNINGVLNNIEEDLDLYSEKEEVWIDDVDIPLPFSWGNFSLEKNENTDDESEDLGGFKAGVKYKNKIVSKKLWKITKTVMEMEARTLELQ